MLFVSYSRRVRQTTLSAIASRADLPSRTSASSAPVDSEARGTPRSPGLTRFASLPALYARTPAPVVTGTGRHADHNRPPTSPRSR